MLATTYYYPKEKKIIEFEVHPWITNGENGAEVGNIFYGSEADKYLTRPARKPFILPDEV
jgi:hypothetical protein